MAVFLSNDWFDQVKTMTDEAGDLNMSPAMSNMTLNLSVSGGPDGDTQASIVNGKLQKGHTDGAKTTLKLDADTLRKVFLESDMNAAMQAFMSGKLKVEGDMSQVMSLQNAKPSAEQTALFQKILAATN